MRYIFTTPSESEPGHRRNEYFVQIFDRVEHRTKCCDLFRNETVRSVDNIAQHVPSLPPPHVLEGWGGRSEILSGVSASLPDSAILALMTAGSNPVESELFSSSAR